MGLDLLNALIRKRGPNNVAEMIEGDSFAIKSIWKNAKRTPTKKCDKIPFSSSSLVKEFMPEKIKPQANGWNIKISDLSECI